MTSSDNRVHPREFFYLGLHRPLLPSINGASSPLTIPHHISRHGTASAVWREASYLWLFNKINYPATTTRDYIFQRTNGRRARQGTWLFMEYEKFCSKNRDVSSVIFMEKQHRVGGSDKFIGEYILSLLVLYLPWRLAHEYQIEVSGSSDCFDVARNRLKCNLSSRKLWSMRQ